MSDLADRLAQVAESTDTQLRPGVVIRRSDDTLGVSVGGARVSPRWLPSAVTPDIGDPVLCARMDGRWYVVGSTSAQPLPPTPVRGTVTAVPSGSSRISVDVAGHGVLEVPFLGSYSPAVGDNVMLWWPVTDSVPTVLGRPGATPTPKPPPPDPTPPPPETGRHRFSARDSGSYMDSAWNSFFDRHLMQGSFSGPSNRGAWFYGSSPTSTLRSRRVTGARLRLGARRRVGNYNSSLTITLQRHTSRTRGSGFPSTTGGTRNITLPVNAGARWVDIPNSWAQAIVDSGGGIALVGSTYGGLVGVGSSSGLDPSSGLLEISWTR